MKNPNKTPLKILMFEMWLINKSRVNPEFLDHSGDMNTAKTKRETYLNEIGILEGYEEIVIVETDSQRKGQFGIPYL